MAVVKNQAIRIAIFILGIVSVALGIMGAFLPVLPTTPFVLLAAWCFVKSSPKAHQWLYRQPVLGKALKDWEENRSIARRTKVLAISMILLSVIFIWVKVSILGVKILVTAILTVVSIFICTRNEGKL